MTTDILLPSWQRAQMSNFLKAWRDSRGLSQEQLALGLGTDKTVVSKLERGTRKLSTQWLERIAKVYGVKPAELLDAPTRLVDPEADQVVPIEPPSQLQAAGTWPRDIEVWGVTMGGSAGDFNLNTGQVIDYARRPPSLQRRKVFALYVQGSSMSPWRAQGGLVYLDPVRPPRFGDRVVVELQPDRDGEGHPAYLKELVARTPTKIRLRQYNPDQQIEIPASKVRQIYRVIEWEEVLGV